MKQKPVAVVDANDDGYWADILPNRNVKVGQFLYAHPPQRTEPAALSCCGYTDASAVKWNPLNGVVQCHNCGQNYTTSQRTEPKVCCQEYDTCLEPCTPRGTHLAQRTWVGLTDADFREIYETYPIVEEDPWDYERAIELKLKELNK
jgi:hypothetical protein